MPVTWTLPRKSDAAAIARMQKHFPKPKKPMPEAWFMGKVNFFTWLDHDTDEELLCYALDQIGSGLICFPEVRYVPLWKEWFRYLLPHLILRVRASKNLYSNIFATMIATFFNIYPDEITEEYPGFRDDVMLTLGMEAIPHQLARNSLPEGETDTLFADLWDDRRAETNISFFWSLTIFNGPFLFCLKYLTSQDIEIWGQSLFEIESLQWRIQLIHSITNWFRVLQLAPKEDKRRKHLLYEALRESNLSFLNYSSPFQTFDEFIPPANAKAFERVSARHLSLEMIKSWKQAILAHLDTPAYDVETWFYSSSSIEEEFGTCEALLFPLLNQK